LHRSVFSRRAIPLLAACAAGFLALGGCGYRVAGRANALPPTIRTIAVPAFVNRTSTYRIEDRVTNAVVHELLARTKYRVVAKPDDGDAVLRGEIDTIGGAAMVFDPVTARATTILVTVTVRVGLQDRASGNTLYHNDNLLFREPYEVSTDIPSFFQEEGPALDRMARDLAARLVADMLENF
jgi:hypothetical protein